MAVVYAIERLIPAVGEGDPTEYDPRYLERELEHKEKTAVPIVYFDLSDAESRMATLQANYVNTYTLRVVELTLEEFGGE